MNKPAIVRIFTICVVFIMLVNACKQPAGNAGDDIFCSTLVISADTSCIVFVDGDYQGTFQSGDARKVVICKGEHLVIAKSLDSTVVLAKKIVSVGDSVSKVVDLQIAQSLSIAQTVVSPPQTDQSSSGQVDPNTTETKNVVPQTTPPVEQVVTTVTGTYQDPRDGKTYKTITIGSQTWLAENLAFKANNGCWVYDNNESNASTFGYLYSWETAKTVVPPGWRLPSDADWSKLVKALGGFQQAGGKLKSTAAWDSPNTGATNSSGFSAYPGGYFYTSKNGYYLKGTYGLWWTSTEIGPATAYYYHLLSDNPYAFRSNGKKEDGLSVRCVK